MSPLQCFVLNDFFPWPCKKYVNTLLISLALLSLFRYKTFAPNEMLKQNASKIVLIYVVYEQEHPVRFFCFSFHTILYFYALRLTLGKNINLHELKHKKTYMGFFTWQILKCSPETFHWAQTSYKQRVIRLVLHALKTVLQSLSYKFNFFTTTTYFSFFSNAVLKISSGIDDGIFNMRWELFAYLLLAWVVVYFVVWKGLHNSGKVNKQLSLRSRCWTTGTRQKKFFILIINVQSLWFFKFYLYLPRIFKTNIVDNYFSSFLIIPFWTLIGPGILYQKLIN